MSAHTPGPWEAVDTPAGIRIDGNGGTLVEHIPWRPNASLIAAAPELLACLREIVRDAPESEPEHGDWGGDTERAERWGSAQEHWRLAELARAVLAETEPMSSSGIVSSSPNFTEFRYGTPESRAPLCQRT